MRTQPAKTQADKKNSNCLTIDFSEHKELLGKLKARAKLDVRTPEAQILYLVRLHIEKNLYVWA